MDGSPSTGDTYYVADWFEGRPVPKNHMKMVRSIFSRSARLFGVTFGPIRRDEVEERRMVERDGGGRKCRVYAADPMKGV